MTSAPVRFICQPKQAAEPSPSPEAKDPYKLRRFLDAQGTAYKRAYAEIQRGDKISCWMWYIFPQVDGLGFTYNSKHFGIKSLAEAKAYLAHPILGQRLIDCTLATNDVQGRTANQIFGGIDAVKMRSCATLFEIADGSKSSPFGICLNKYFKGERDNLTIDILNKWEAKTKPYEKLVWIGWRGDVVEYVPAFKECSEAGSIFRARGKSR